jgi:hypothetical protein
VLGLAVPLAFYAGFRLANGASDTSAARLASFAQNALETVRAGSLTEKIAAEDLRARNDMVRKQLLDSFNDEMKAARKAQAQEYEATVVSTGEKVKVPFHRLDPLSPDEMRNLEPIT